MITILMQPEVIISFYSFRHFPAKEPARCPGPCRQVPLVRAIYINKAITGRKFSRYIFLHEAASSRAEKQRNAG
jgi:hypothetical protein